MSMSVLLSRSGPSSKELQDASGWKINASLSVVIAKRGEGAMDQNITMN